MLPFKLNGVSVLTFHSMLTTHLVDSLSHIPGLTAWSAMMAIWQPVHSARKALALNAWRIFF